MSRGRAAVRTAEAALIATGIASVLVASDRVPGLVLVSLWDLLAGLYVGIGAVLVRRETHRDPSPNFWFSMLFTATASVVGMATAGRAILIGPADAAENVLGVAAMILSWLLLHSGWARLYHARAAGGLEFPREPRPGRIEFLYFAFTIAVSFAVSDVTVTTRDARWHVTVHSVVSFFYNAAVIALAIGTITG